MRNVAAPVLPLQLPEIAKILDTRGRDYFIETRSQMFGQPLMSIFPNDRTAEKKMIGQAVKEMDIIVQMLKRSKLPGESGCFLEGRQASYADFTIVAVLGWFHRGRSEIWRQLLQTGDGELERLGMLASHGWTDREKMLNGQHNSQLINRSKELAQ